MRYRVSEDDRFSHVASRYGLAPAQLLAMNPHVPRGRTLAGAPCVREDAWQEGLVLQVGRLGDIAPYDGGELPGTNGAYCPPGSEWDTTNKNCVPKSGAVQPPVCKPPMMMWDKKNGTCGSSGVEIKLIPGTNGGFCPSPFVQYEPATKLCGGVGAASPSCPMYAVWNPTTATCVILAQVQPKPTTLPDAVVIPGTHGGFCAPGLWSYDAALKKCTTTMTQQKLDPSCPPGESWVPQGGACTETQKNNPANQPKYTWLMDAKGNCYGGPPGAPQGLPCNPTDKLKKPGPFQDAPSPDPTWPKPGLTSPPSPAVCALDPRIKGPGTQSLYDPKTKMCVWPTGDVVIPNCPGLGLFNKVTETCGPPRDESSGGVTKGISVPVIVAGVAVAGVAIGLFLATVSGSAAKNRK